MQRPFHSKLLLIAALMTVVWTAGCSDEQFIGRQNVGSSSAKLTNTMNDKTRTADQKLETADGGEDDSGDGDDTGDSGDTLGEDTDGDMESENDADIDEDDWELEEEDRRECRFFADEDYAEVVEGGPDLSISPQNMDGDWEGDDFVFTFDAWQGAMGATAQLYDGHGPVIQIGGGVDLPDYPAAVAHLMPKDKDHWQLTPILMGGVAKYGVKHSYQGVIKDADHESCEISLTETETPFLDRTGGGCFALTTLIRMADGRDQFVALLNVGDMVLNPVTGKPARIEEIVSGPETDSQMIKVGYGANVVRVTQMHPMPTARGLLQARHLTATDKILGADGRYHAVTKLERMPLDKSQVVRNLVINGNTRDANEHMLLADGVVTGDLYLQRSLETKGQFAGGDKRIDGILLSQAVAL